MNCLNSHDDLPVQNIYSEVMFRPANMASILSDQAFPAAACSGNQRLCGKVCNVPTYLGQNHPQYSFLSFQPNQSHELVGEASAGTSTKFSGQWQSMEVHIDESHFVASSI